MTLKRDAGKTADDGGGRAEFELQTTESPKDNDSSTDGREVLVATLAKLDAERQALVQSTISQLTAGAAVDKDTYRRIKAIDAQKNRLLIARFTSLLRDKGPVIKPLVEALLKI